LDLGRLGSGQRSGVRVLGCQGRLELSRLPARLARLARLARQLRRGRLLGPGFPLGFGPACRPRRVGGFR
jgi:hypothetical protein